MLKKDRAFFILNRLNEIYPETPIPLYHENKFELPEHLQMFLKIILSQSKYP